MPRDETLMRPRLFLAVLVACGARTQLDGSGGSGGDSLDPDFAWYKLGETSGDTAHDSTPHHYDVSLSGIGWNDGGVFDSVCGKVDVDEAIRSAPLTISAWLSATPRSDEAINAYFFTPFPSNAVSGDIAGPGGFGIGLNVWDGGAAFAAETGTDATKVFHSVLSSFAAGTLYHLVEVVRSNDALLYVDGALRDTVFANTPPAVTPALLRLGCHNEDPGYGSKRFFRGTMRDVRIFKRDLSAADVAALHANGPIMN
jgi:hypothetical protein